MKGKHRAPSTIGPTLVKVGSLTVAVPTLALVLSGSASAAPDGSALEHIASCESGNKNIPTGIKDRNGRPLSTASGYLQILDSTWRAFGGSKFGQRALHASREEQFIVGRNILAGQGLGAWSESRSCWGKRLGKPAPVQKVTIDVPKAEKKPVTVKKADPPKTIKRSPKPIIKPVPPKAESAPKTVKKVFVAPPKQQVAKRVAPTYLIKRGDTLTRIAKHHGTSVIALVKVNRDTVRNPDRIYAGKTLRLG